MEAPDRYENGVSRDGGLRWLGWVVAWTAATLAGGVPLAGQQTGSRGRVVGRIVDQITGDALASAQLEIEGTNVKGPASPDGRFMLPPLSAGIITLRVTHPGYLPRTEEVEILAGQTVDLRISLIPDQSYELDPLVVEIRSRVLERRGFYERRSQGYSAVFLTREDIAERGAQKVTEVLDDIPGVRVLAGGLEGARIVFQRGVSLRDSGVCAPALYLDGVKSQIRVYDAILDPSHIEGMEVYLGATVPGQYSDPCGAILVWTRVP